MDSDDLKNLIKGSHDIFLARGEKNSTEEEQKTINFAFPSVVSLMDIHPGTKLSQKNIFLKRPGGGDFGINDLNSLYGKIVTRFIKKNTQIKKN